MMKNSWSLKKINKSSGDISRNESMGTLMEKHKLLPQHGVCMLLLEGEEDLHEFHAAGGIGVELLYNMDMPREQKLESIILCLSNMAILCGFQTIKLQQHAH